MDRDAGAHEGPTHEDLRVEVTYLRSGVPCTDEVATHLTRTWRDPLGRIVIQECIGLSPMREPTSADVLEPHRCGAELRLFDLLLDELSAALRRQPTDRDIALGLLHALRGAVDRLCGPDIVGPARLSRLRRAEHRLGLVMNP